MSEVMKEYVAPDFKSFQDIKNIDQVIFHITQKVHGTNAQILVYEKEDGTLDLLCGCRTKWIYAHSAKTDNYGFATFVNAHKQEFIEKLGKGRHDGEWAGPGINNGEGLKEKTFVLFRFWEWPPERSLPPRTVVVPLLYQGPVEMGKVDEVMADLQDNGSKLAPGFMTPEGVVVQLGATRYKKTFTAEQSAWKGVKSGGSKEKLPVVDYTHLCQPIRLEKLLSRDEAYVREYPKSLHLIVKDYIADLIKEDQIVGSEDEKAAIAKSAMTQIFKFVRTVADDMPIIKFREGNE